MIDVFLAPKQYIQRDGILAEAGTYLEPFGKRPLVLSDELVFSIARPTLEDALRTAGMEPTFELFGEEPSFYESSRLEPIAKEKNADFIVGMGGGRPIDTARLLADRLNLPLVNLPTSAATCASASAAAVVYDKGIRETTIDGKAAELVLVDSGIISKAPTRLLAAGMADAVTKWYEGRYCYVQMEGIDTAVQTAMNLSIQVKETVLSIGMQAYRDVGAGKNSNVVEAIIDCNILLPGVISAIGGSKFRIAVPHALLYGMTVIPGIHENLHGEMVAFGIIAQLCMEKDEKELETILPFFSALELPLTMKALGLPSVNDPLFQEGLKRTCAKGSSVHNMPFTVTEKMLQEAILEADERAASII